MTYFFLGERPSRTALARGVTWRDGRLAAKQLFDALTHCGISPAQCRFDNIFLPDLAKERRKPWLRRTLVRAMRRGETLVAMGQKVARVLQEIGVPHTTIVHPAARGKIRGKAVYAAHVQERLR
jgi:hypothetical protein